MTNIYITMTNIYITGAIIDNANTFLVRRIAEALKSGSTPGDAAADLGLDLGETEDGYPLVLLPGWVADDGNQPVYFADVDTAREAAEEYVAGGEWGERNKTIWINLYAWRIGVTDAGDEPATDRTDTESHTVTLEPDEPECVEAEHCWHETGVSANAGGVIVRYVCEHCELAKIVNTWDQNPANGVLGLESVEYYKELF